MRSHEIRPKQLRALLLLLVLVPLIPMTLMVRFMADALKGERLAAVERTQQLYSEWIETALKKVPSTEGTPAQRASQLHATLQGLMDARVSIRIIDGAGRWVAGEPSPSGKPIAQITAPGGIEGLVQVFLTGPELLDEQISGQRQIYVWTAVITTLALLLIAGTAALAVRRQIQLHELKSTSVATVAHELRTPLGSMRMLVDTLREGRYRSEHQLKEYLDLIATENDRLSRLAENFLTFSRFDRGAQGLELVPVKPHAVAEQAVAPLRPRLEAPGCQFTLDVPESLPAIRADRDALAQVLTNLLDNAVKYTGTDKRIALRARAENSTLAFSVSDDGIGIPENQYKAVFEPFYQVDHRLSRSGEGCGLGLAIVRRIVTAHGGEIGVASEREKGSVFTVRIPLS